MLCPARFSRCIGIVTDTYRFKMLPDEFHADTEADTV